MGSRDASYGISNDFDNPNKRRSYWLLNPPLTFSFCLKPIVTREILGILLHICYLWSRCWYSRCFGNDPERKKIFRQIDISKSVMFTVTYAEILLKNYVLKLPQLLLKLQFCKHKLIFTNFLTHSTQINNDTSLAGSSTSSLVRE